MEDIISQAKAELNRAKDRIAHVLAKTPDDKINWSPSPTARTPLQIVGHAAASNLWIRDMMAGKPFPFASLAEADAAGRTGEKQFTTREQVSGLLEQTTADYFAWLDTLTPEQIGGMVTLPFGAMPMAVAITIPADHIRGHAAQLDYVQTCYGDHDWHMGD
jgi:hypothetical protein